MTETMPVEAYLELVSKPASKWRNQKVKVGKLKFDSKLEHARYLVLLERSERGDIHGLKLQPEYVILKPFTDNMGVKHQGIKYRADFSYQVTVGRKVYNVTEDVKGKKTQVYIDKSKWFRFLNPDIYFFEIEKDTISLDVEWLLSERKAA